MPNKLSSYCLVSIFELEQIGGRCKSSFSTRSLWHYWSKTFSTSNKLTIGFLFNPRVFSPTTTTTLSRTTLTTSSSSMDSFSDRHNRNDKINIANTRISTDTRECANVTHAIDRNLNWNTNNKHKKMPLECGWMKSKHK